MDRTLAIPTTTRASIFRVTRADAIVASLALAVGVVEAALVWVGPRLGAAGLGAAACLVALGIVWTSNTVAHIHLHTPLFTRRRWNAALSLWLSAVLHLPQTLWKHRHLAHHAETAPKKLRLSAALAREVAAALLCAALFAWLSPRYFFFAHLPGFFVGLALCQVSGVFEHRAAGEPVPEGVSTYGRLYNLTWLNDGFHREHHAAPAAHWTTLPARRVAGAAISGRAPLLRPLDEPWMALALGWLERVVLTQRWLARWVVATHREAIRPLLAAWPAPPRRIAIVGGGLFPRTALVFQDLLPEARLTVIDRSRDNLALARRALSEQAAAISFVEGSFEPDAHADFDLVVLPLALVASGRELSSGRPTLVHAWIGRRLDGPSRVVSWLLWKKVTLLPCG